MTDNVKWPVTSALNWPSSEFSDTFAHQLCLVCQTCSQTEYSTAPATSTFRMTKFQPLPSAWSTRPCWLSLSWRQGIAVPQSYPGPPQGYYREWKWKHLRWRCLPSGVFLTENLLPRPNAVLLLTGSCLPFIRGICTIIACSFDEKDKTSIEGKSRPWTRPMLCV